MSDKSQTFSAPVAGEIRAELSRILDSPAFAGSQKLRAFLRFIVEETLAGRGDTLKAYTIAVEALKCGQDFDPQKDPAVRVSGTRLRGRLQNYYQHREPGGGLKIDLPRGGYKPVFIYLDADQGEPRQLAAPEGSGRAKPTIAILPFINLGNDAGIEHLIYGLSEEIAIGLSHFEDFAITNALHIHRNQQSPEPLWDIARNLEARFILHGSIQLISGVIRIRVSLVDAASKASLWAEKFDHSYTAQNFFKILDEITTQVATHVGGSFGAINRLLAREKSFKGVMDLEIYEAILRYHHWVATISRERVVEAQQALERAIALDPGYALPYALLADIYAAQYQWGYESSTDFLERSLRLALKALDLDSGCQYAQWAWAFNLYLRGDGEQCLQGIRKAISINPYNANIISTCGIKVCMLGHWEEGLALIDRGVQLKRNVPGWVHIARVTHCYLNENYAEALSLAKFITTPDFWGGPLLRAAIYGKMHRAAEGRAALDELMALCPRFSKDHLELMHRLFFQKTTVDKILEGLNLSGL